MHDYSQPIPTPAPAQTPQQPELAVTPTKKRPDLPLILVPIGLLPPLIVITTLSIGIDHKTGEVGFNPFSTWFFVVNGIVFWIGVANLIINKRKILLAKDALVRQVLVYVSTGSLAIVPLIGYLFQNEWGYASFVITVFSISLLAVMAFSPSHSK